MDRLALPAGHELQPPLTVLEVGQIVDYRRIRCACGWSMTYLPGVPDDEAAHGMAEATHARELAEQARYTLVHLCPAEGCRRRVPSPRLMCSPHWRMVPLEIQRAVCNAYRTGQWDEKTPSADWMAARYAALKAVHEKEQARA